MEMISNTANLHENITIFKPTIIGDNVNAEKDVKIGKYTFIDNSTNIFELTSIGNHCNIGRECLIGIKESKDETLKRRIYPTESCIFNSKTTISKHNQNIETEIGHAVHLGARCIVHQGVKIGAGSHIASGSVITSDIPPFSIVSGNPAAIEAMSFPQNAIDALLNEAWWDFNLGDLQDIDFQDIFLAVNQLSSLRMRMVLNNQRYLSGILKNNASMSKSGIIWLKSEFSHMDKDALDLYKYVTVHSVTGASSELVPPGDYKIHKSSFDPARGWYRLNIIVNQKVFTGEIKKNDFIFSLRY